MLNFDATQYSPDQGMPKHPTGKFPAAITQVVVEGKSEKDHHVAILFTTPAGSIKKQYNVATESTEQNMMQMADIARRNLSALCHVTGVFKLATGQELVNARLMIEITPQAKNDKYNEVSKVYDAAGNEPGKAPAAAQGGSWGGQPQQPAPAPQNAPQTAANGPAWGNGQTQPAQQQPAQQAAAWSPGPATGAQPNPPWGQK